MYKPTFLLVTADGPRENRPEDIKYCAETRAIIDTVDWKCDVVKNYSDVNMGSFKRNFSGLTRVFEEVEEAIILEDDCLPHPSFFLFCEELLDRYRDDTRIGIISGDNFKDGGTPGGDSYFFSQYVFTWGWASWRRTWKLVDPEMLSWPEFRKGGLRSVLQSNSMRRYWERIFQAIYDRTRRPAWDYLLMLACFTHNLVNIVPNVNLVTNIGFGDSGTNCMDPEAPGANILVHAMQFPLMHPPHVIPDHKADRQIHRNHFDVPIYTRIQKQTWRAISRMWSRI